MLRIFYGEDRVAAEKEISQLLGDNYEVFDGESLEISELPNIFQGMSLLFGEKRQILIKNASENATVWEKLADYKDTEHEVVVWELKLDKRLSGYKLLKDADVKMKEFAVKAPDTRAVFGILDLAMRDGQKAVAELKKIEGAEDPFMFFGLLVSQVLKKYEASGSARERRILKMLAETDLTMKSTALEPWKLIESFLLRVKP